MTDTNDNLPWTPDLPAQTDRLAAGVPALDHYAIAVPLADLYREPDPASELVNQAHLGTPAARLGTSQGGAWTWVRLPDYAGWIASATLVPQPPPPPAAAPHAYVRVIAPRATVKLARGKPLTLFAGALLRREDLQGEQVIVLLPDGRRGRIPTVAVAPLLEHGGRRGDAAAVLKTAHKYLTTPYLWGGMSSQGIDCSGFVQIVYRLHGYPLPRDADQQYHDLPQAVERGQWQPGDLLFYGPSAQRITHVALYLGDGRVIHAQGQDDPPSVLIQSADPTRPDYAPRLVHTYIGARRVIGAAPPPSGAASVL